MLSSIKHIRRIPKIARCVGFENLIPRSSYLLQKKTGILKRRTRPSLFDLNNYRRSTCFGDVSTKTLWESKKKHFFPTAIQQALKETVSETQWEKQVTNLCNSAIDGKYNFFSRWEGELDWPPKFNLDPVHNSTWSTAGHWTHVKCSASPPSDIKLVWEASRLSLAYCLSREYVYSENEKWAEYFWELIESWIDQNPVNQTIAWSCGQEVSFRAMAILWGLFATLDSPSTTPDRLDRVHFLIWQTGKRIAATTNYAISQENNHSLSEATVLWTIGLLFSEFKESDQWKKQGKKILAKEAARQIYADGSYVQHSLNYHRVMMDDLMWAIRIGELNGEPLPDAIYDRFRVTTRWLQRFVDSTSGGVPNYGCNDGANVLPLSCTDYTDYRPTLRAAEVIAGLKSTPTTDLRLNEKALWLTGKNPTEEDTKRSDLWSADIGGYHVIETDESKLFLRCTNYLDRPGQEDMLHVDLWHKGVNILQDSGSYLYNDVDPATEVFFNSIKAHNTVEVDQRNQMTKGPGFLWIDWPITTLNSIDLETGPQIVATAKYRAHTGGYQHRRTIIHADREFKIFDEVKNAPSFFVHWHFNQGLIWHELQKSHYLARHRDFGIEIKFEGYSGINFTKSPQSLYYGQKKDSCHVIVEVENSTLMTSISFLES